MINKAKTILARPVIFCIIASLLTASVAFSSTSHAKTIYPVKIGKFYYCPKTSPSGGAFIEAEMIQDEYLCMYEKPNSTNHYKYDSFRINGFKAATKTPDNSWKSSGHYCINENGTVSYKNCPFNKKK